MATALITGSTKGIGKAIAERLLANGWTVYGVGRSASEITNPNYHHLQFDLTNFAGLDGMLAQIESATIDLLVNNSGNAISKSIKEVDMQTFDDLFNLNLKSVVFLTQKLLRKLGTGKVINVSSDGASITYPTFGTYSMTKAGLNMFTRYLNLETEVNAFTVSPDAVDTPLTRRLITEADVFPKYLKSEDVADVVDQVIANKYERGTEIIIINNYELKDLEGAKLKRFVYNADTKTSEPFSI